MSRSSNFAIQFSCEYFCSPRISHFCRHFLLFSVAYLSIFSLLCAHTFRTSTLNTQAVIKDCLSPYYNLREWADRYVVTTLGSEVEDFPGQGNGNHPPLSPLNEFYLSSSDEDNDDGAHDDTFDHDDADADDENDGTSSTIGLGGTTTPPRRGASTSGTSNSGEGGEVTPVTRVAEGVAPGSSRSRSFRSQTSSRHTKSSRMSNVKLEDDDEEGSTSVDAMEED